MKTRLVEITNIFGDRLWVVEKSNGTARIFVKKSAARLHKALHHLHGILLKITNR